MADLPTRTDLFDAGAREVIARSDVRAPGKRVAPEAIYTEGTDINILLAGASAMAEDVLRQAGKSVAALYLDSAKGDDLDRLVTDRYAREVVRREPAPAVALVTLTRTSGALPGVTLNAGDKVRTAGGVEFEFSAAVSIPALSNGPVTGTVRAVLAGSAGNVALGTITEIVNSPDSALQVTNAAAATGGADREMDASYRDRARAFFKAARRGTLAAIEFGARSVEGVALVNAVEELDISGNPTGVVYVYIADATGQANAALVERVEIALLEYRCLGIPPFVVGAVPEYVLITYRLRFEASVDPTLAFEQLRFATVALVNQTAPNKPLEVSLLLSLARRVPGVIVRQDALVTPLGDVYPTAGRVLRTTSDRVSLVVA